MFNFQGANLVPGLQTVLETTENQFWIGRWENQIWHYGDIVSTAVDAGNTNGTTTLRAGLLLGQITASGKLKQWDPAATDGSQNVYGILGAMQPMRYGAGSSTADRLVGMVMVAGRIDPAKLIVPGDTTLGIAGTVEEFDIRNQLGTRFMFADGLISLPVSGWYGPVAKTGNYTVLDSDNNTLFTNSGAAGTVNFTLPVTAKKGLRYAFYVAADQTLTVTSGTADTMVVFNDIAADSISFGTAGEKVGGMITVIGDGSKWLTIVNLGAETQTPTIVTA